jgi:quercetin 2,3-dioxygenase
MKQIKTVIQAPAKHWVGDGFHVHGFFSQFSEDISPFLLLDYAPIKHFPPSNKPRGVGQHPHRGFETVTFAYRGAVNHKDSSGSVGTISEGDIQWMTAGSGVIHQEYFEYEFNKSGGEFSMVQLWVNLPAQFKMVKPRYQELLSKDLPTISHNGIDTRVVAGTLQYLNSENQYNIIEGVAKTYSKIDIYQISSSNINPSNITIKLPTEQNTMILVLSGPVEINDVNIDSNNLVVFDRVGEIINIQFNTTSEILVLSATPLNEPIAHYGPFVMNTEQELIQAVDDFNNGLFGKV